MREEAFLVPSIARRCLLLPEPVNVTAQIDRDEEQLRLIRILCSFFALQQVLMDHLHMQLQLSSGGTEAYECHQDARDGHSLLVVPTVHPCNTAVCGMLHAPVTLQRPKLEKQPDVLTVSARAPPPPPQAQNCVAHWLPLLLQR